MYLILIAGLWLPFFSLGGLLDPIISTLHGWCLDRISTHTFNTEIYSALICGKRLTFGGELRKIFTDAGLIHLMVVSGAHLLFLEKIFKFLPKFPFKNGFIFFSLVFYSLIAGLHPPIFRALVSFFLSVVSQKFRLFWTPYWRIMFSGIICLVLNPQWISSTSLQLSWIGALAFSTARYSRFLSQVLAYFLILPVISQWTGLHPLSIWINWIMFPVISMILFPLSVLSFIIPVVSPVTNFFWTHLIGILEKLQPVFQQTPFYIPYIPQKFRWIYIGCLFFIGQMIWVLVRRYRR